MVVKRIWSTKSLFYAIKYSKLFFTIYTKKRCLEKGSRQRGLMPFLSQISEDTS